MKSSLFSTFTLINIGIGLGFVSVGLLAQDSLQHVADSINMAMPNAPLPPNFPAGMPETYSSAQGFVEIARDIVPVTAFLAFFYAVVTMFKAFFDYRLKTRLVEKEVPTESLQHYFLPTKPEPRLYESLKWGLVAAGLGLGLCIANYLPLGLISVGVVVLFVAAGFITYFVILSKRFNEN